MRSFSTSILVALLLGVDFALGDNDLKSCVDVECPRTPAHCTVANQTLLHIGLTSVDAPVDNSPDFTWTVGMEDHMNFDPSNLMIRNIERVYYLGTPASVDLTASNLSYAGCAFVLTGADNTNLFGSPATNRQYCDDLMGNDCEDDLEARIKELLLQESTSDPVSDVCSNIATALQSSIPSRCTGLGPSTLVKSASLTGADAQVPYGTAGNSNDTSDCWPTLPKSNALTRVLSYNITANINFNETAPAVLGQSPLLTLWYNAGNASTSDDDLPEVEMSCMRIIDQSLPTGNNSGAASSAVSLQAGNFGLVFLASLSLISAWIVGGF